MRLMMVVGEQDQEPIAGTALDLDTSEWNTVPLPILIKKYIKPALFALRAKTRPAEGGAV